LRTWTSSRFASGTDRGSRSALAGRGLGPADIADAFALYEQALTLMEVGLRFGVSRARFGGHSAGPGSRSDLVVAASAEPSRRSIQRAGGWGAERSYRAPIDLAVGDGEDLDPCRFGSVEAGVAAGDERDHGQAMHRVPTAPDGRRVRSRSKDARGPAGRG